MKKRTRARELALQFLYQLDLCGKSVLPEARAFVQGEERDAETARFALRLVEGTHEKQADLDRAIQSVAQNWSIARMAVIDRNVLRLATYELLHCPDVPPKVAINEAIELGKRYSTQNSGAFINGILDKIMNQPAAAPRADAHQDGNLGAVGPSDAPASGSPAPPASSETLIATPAAVDAPKDDDDPRETPAAGPIP